MKKPFRCTSEVPLRFSEIIEQPEFKDGAHEAVNNSRLMAEWQRNESKQYQLVLPQRKVLNWHTGVEKNALGYCATFKVDNATFLLLPYDTLEEAQEYQELLFKALSRFGNNTSMKSFALWLAANHWAIKDLNNEIYYGNYLEAKTLDELLKQFLTEYPNLEESQSEPLTDDAIEKLAKEFADNYHFGIYSEEKDKAHIRGFIAGFKANTSQGYEIGKVYEISEDNLKEIV